MSQAIVPGPRRAGRHPHRPRPPAGEARAGALEVDLAAGGRAAYYFVDGGVAQMKDNRLTILTEAA